jgi:hypothetical protein
MRGRTPRPDLARRDNLDRVAHLRRIADELAAGRPFLEALALAATEERLAVLPEPDVMLVRHLRLEHLGRWIYLPGRPALLGAAYTVEPTLAATAGRLVGIRPGKPGHHDVPGSVVLVIQQGATVAELPTRVDDRVDVAPREWNL